jgi:hypothetical protein
MTKNKKADKGLTAYGFSSHGNPATILLLTASLTNLNCLVTACQSNLGL